MAYAPASKKRPEAEIFRSDKPLILKVTSGDEVVLKKAHIKKSRVFANTPSEELLSFATGIWGDRQSALQWFASPHPELQGQTPISVLDSKEGTQKVEDLLGALDYGFPV